MLCFYQVLNILKEDVLSTKLCTICCSALDNTYLNAKRMQQFQMALFQKFMVSTSYIFKSCLADYIFIVNLFVTSSTIFVFLNNRFLQLVKRNPLNLHSKQYQIIQLRKKLPDLTNWVFMIYSVILMIHLS